MSAAFELAARRPRPRGVASAYLQLTKPRIISLLLITTVPSMILADRGLPSLWLIAATLVGGMSSDGRLPTHRAETVELVGLYWHFVDIVWIIIFAVVYLIPAAR